MPSALEIYLNPLISKTGQIEPFMLNQMFNHAV
ncbi:Uncharacterised protein [Vibrio cholerae]|nr:Uncharacterised protein [Vibrio cholerae]